MAVDHEMVSRVAGLARLKLAPAEVAPLADELNKILSWIDALQEIDTGDIQPMNAVIPNSRPWREDAVTDGNIQSDVLANAPDAAHGFFAVPKVIE